MRRMASNRSGMRVQGVGMAALLVLVSACVAPAPGPSDDAGTVDAGQQTPDTGATDGGPSSPDAGAADAGDVTGGCTAGEVGCVDDFTAFACDATGTTRTETSCGSSTYCNGGTCIPQMCVPGNALTCLAQNVRGVCNASGSNIDALSCAPGEGCQDGECKPCICSPDITRRCGTASLASRERCNLNCVSYRPDNCAANQTCTGNGVCTAQLCTPSAPGCDGTSGTRTCDPDGLGYGPTTPCGASSSCDAATGLCAAWTCTPGTESCNANSRSVCNTDGLGETLTACGTGESCSGAGVCAIRCGDNIRGGTEECDDGNTAGGDGCSATCETEWPLSCLAVRDAVVSPAVATSGVYRIDPDGTGGEASLDVYCDMTSDGGGWTMVVAQFDSSPETDWNRGKLTLYDPTLATGRSFALKTEQIPTHTQTAFGRGTVATFLDYVNFVYITSNIPVTTVTGLRTSNTYQIHREMGAWFNAHDPETAQRPSGDCSFGWCNTLTFDQTGGSAFTWAFSPSYSVRSYRGFALAADLRTTNDTFAWTVWVR
jgi:cysteine-rich repeat protein